jgi:membrane protease YdiL (CAAX protease family)
LLALLFLLLAPRTGWKLGLAALPAWILVESVCAVAAVGLVVAAVAQSRQRRADGWQDYAGPSPFLVMPALLAVVTGLGLPIERSLTGAGLDTDSGLGTLLLLLVYLGAYVGFVHFLTVRPGAMTWRDILRPKRIAPDPDDWQSATPVPEFRGPPGLPLSGNSDRTSPDRLSAGSRSRVGRERIVDILLPVAMLLPLVIASSIANQALLLVLGLKMRDLTSPLPTSGLGLDPWITLFAVAIVVPIGEEIFFRGFATNAWGRSLGRDSAILRAALFFAFIHVLNVSNTDPGLALRAGVFNFAARVPVTVALTWLYFRRRSILASGTLHASFNGLIQLLSMMNI